MFILRVLQYGWMISLCIVPTFVPNVESGEQAVVPKVESGEQAVVPKVELGEQRVKEKLYIYFMRIPKGSNSHPDYHIKNLHLWCFNIFLFCFFAFSLRNRIFNMSLKVKFGKVYWEVFNILFNVKMGVMQLVFKKSKNCWINFSIVILLAWWTSQARY